MAVDSARSDAARALSRAYWDSLTDEERSARARAAAAVRDRGLSEPELRERMRRVRGAAKQKRNREPKSLKSQANKKSHHSIK